MTFEIISEDERNEQKKAQLLRIENEKNKPAFVLSKQQLEIVESPEHKIVVMASAGAGKTRVLTERVRWILKNGGDPSKMVIITFTRNSAQEMRDRLGDDYKDGMYIGTVHGYAHYLLSKHGISTHHLTSESNFDGLFELVMENPQVVEPIGFLALDESQDSSNQQYEFIFEMLAPTAFFAVGDVRQNIYGFAGANPKRIMALTRDDEVMVYNLTENYRNGSEIIHFSNDIANKMKDIPRTPVKAMRGTTGKVIQTNGTAFLSMIAKDPSKYGDWAILCRSNAKMFKIMGQLRAKGIPCLTFKQAQGSNADLADMMAENSVKVLTVHSAKGLEFEKVVVAEQSWRSEDDRKLMYVAATRAIDELYMVLK